MTTVTDQPGEPPRATERVVIVGAGQAGAQVAAGLRKHGHTGPVTLIGDEPHLPYERPPLSKGFLRGECSADRIAVKSPRFYPDARISLLLGNTVSTIDRARRVVRFDDGWQVPYERLVLTTGARARRLNLPGSDTPALHYLRTLADAALLRSALAGANRVVVIGGGLIGMEVAATAAQAGKDVTVLEAAPQIMSRVLPDPLGARLAELHRHNGVEIRTGVCLRGFEPGQSATGVHTDTGVILADLIVAGIGAVPNTELAETAGLEVSDGVVVDEYGATADPAVFAAGDVSRHFNPLLSRHIRLESWHNAQNHGLAVGASVAGHTAPYRDVPWSWSDQYHLQIQIAGMPEGWPPDMILRRGQGDALTALAVEDGRLVAAVCVNQPHEMRAARSLIAQQRTMDPAVLHESSRSLTALATAAA